MKAKTTNNLNTAAKSIASDMLIAVRGGGVFRVGHANEGKTDELIAIRETIRHMRSHFTGIAYSINLANVIKTTQQFNYLANEVLNILRRSGDFFSCEFKMVDPKQMEFDFMN